MIRKKSNKVKIALDCMGGDNAPEVVIEGVKLAVNKLTDLHFLLYGKKDKIDPLISQSKGIEPYITTFDIQSVILPTDKPSVALRKRKSSMHAAIESIKKGEADCALSAGNTGALMAISRLILGMLPSINRPAIVTAIPAKNNEIVFLDLGANVDCDGKILSQFALMGHVFAANVFCKKNPTVALLNIGSEEVKGTEAVKDAYSLLNGLKGKINFQGYIEPDKMFNSNIDVVVTDGFCGNIMLKSMEGLFKLIKSSIQDFHPYSISGMIKSILLKLLLKKKLHKFNPKFRNGAMLIGLDGIVIKSHGNACAESFANAISVAVSAAKSEINAQITL
ncbi:MAG: phosphate acyltransferase PlsX [Rickettsiaceae bacterium H1]|nr:phosphate acyltransferase PlsX [Rickettsiaceae bacterium H1]